MSRVGHGVQVCVSWVPARDGDIPYNAIAAAPDLFVARATFADDVIPGKLVRGHQCVYISYDGKEESVDNYEVLCCTGLGCFGEETMWLPAGSGEVPPGALVAGHSERQEPLYVARVVFNGEWCVGKVHSGHGCAYLPWGGEEHRIDEYEVFCCCV